MWLTIKNICERHTILNMLSARCKFYTANMEENETVLKFTSRIRQIAATLKSVGVEIPLSEMQITLLNVLPEDNNALINALDAIDDEDNELDWEFDKFRVMQEEQHISMRHKSAVAK